MSANREFDALIAEKVFGWTWEPSPGDAERMLVPPADDERRIWAASWDDKGRPHWLPPYSTDIDAASDVLAQLGGIVKITRMAPNDWRVAIGDGPQYWAETLPLAICRAALGAVEVPS